VKLCKLDVKNVHSHQGVIYFRVKGKRFRSVGHRLCDQVHTDVDMEELNSLTG
jgi:hypothetical protein